MRGSGLLVLCALLWGCATPARLVTPPPASAGEKPILYGAHGPLSAERSRLILAAAAKEAGSDDILTRHVAVEEAITRYPLTIGNKVTLLRDGPATYRAMYQAIRKAKDHINLETYIFEDDEVGRQLSDLLIARQRDGVQVNVIHDSVGTIKTPEAFFERLKQAGVNVLEFNPINPAAVKKNKKWEVDHRDHRKLLVVDGRSAFTGGINFSSVYSGGSLSSAHRVSGKDDSGKPRIPWRDTHIQIEGPVVAEFQRLFIGTWKKQHGPALAHRHYFPQAQERGTQIVRAIGSSPDERISVIHTTLLSAIAHAERSIYITNAYFVPDESILRAVRDAARRGVDVKMILPSESDFWAPLYAGRSYYSDLLEAGVKVFEREEAMLHAKTIVIDGVWSTVGSTNLDQRSFLDNDEINAVILGRDFAEQMEAMFAEDLTHSKPILLAQWRHRGLGSRFKEMGARLWQRWL